MNSDDTTWKIMRKNFENYGDLKFALEEARDNLEVLIHDCEESAEEESDRIMDDCREARFYAEFLEKLMKGYAFSDRDKDTLKYAVIWLYSIVRRKEAEL